MRATEHPLNNTIDTRRPGVTQAQDGKNEMETGTTQNNRTESPVRTAETTNPSDEVTEHEDDDTTPDLTPIESAENNDDLEQTRTGEHERKSTPTLGPFIRDATDQDPVPGMEKHPGGGKERFDYCQTPNVSADTPLPGS